MDFALIKVDNRPIGGIPPTDAVAVCIENIVRPSNAVPHVSAVVKWRFHGISDFPLGTCGEVEWKRK